MDGELLAGEETDNDHGSRKKKKTRAVHFLLCIVWKNAPTSPDHPRSHKGKRCSQLLWDAKIFAKREAARGNIIHQIGHYAFDHSIRVRLSSSHGSWLDTSSHCLLGEGDNRSQQHTHDHCLYSPPLLWPPICKEEREKNGDRLFKFNFIPISKVL